VRYNLQWSWQHVSTLAILVQSVAGTASIHWNVHPSTLPCIKTPMIHFICTDVDECSLRRDLCQHNCTNTRGGYFCSCPPGYRLDADGFSCKG
jgi:hypothetical protein